MKHLKQVVGVGVDIQSVPRIQQLVSRKNFEYRFIQKVLHPQEIELYHSKDDEGVRMRFLASRWAFKEAMVKATGNRSLRFDHMHLGKEDSGKPYVMLEEDVLAMIPIMQDTKEQINVSISHEESHAVAVVIIQELVDLNKLAQQLKFE